MKPLIEPLSALAFSMQSMPGGYAVLLGSGVSRGAEIPTGWEITLDLIQKLARLEGEDPGRDIEGWFRKKHGVNASYSELIEALAPTPAERRELLRSYFEPTTNDERERGVKIPTVAHRAIAGLVVQGIVRVVVTTNFDQLIETALRDAGVTPTVIASEDAVAGMLPLAHERAIVIKLHGDYRDSRIRNTPAELSSYPPKLNELLDRIFDEYGLIVSGWSAEWDDALRAALVRCPSRRFTTYWTHVNADVSDKVSELIAHRRAARIQVQSADAFWGQIEERVRSLSELRPAPPGSAAVAVSTLKRLLPRAGEYIRLNDFIGDETERVYAELIEQPLGWPDYSWERINVWYERAESRCETLMAMLVVGVYWGAEHHQAVWLNTITRLLNPPRNPLRDSTAERLQRYPAQLAMYAAGLGALMHGDRSFMLDVFLKPAREQDGQRKSAVQLLHLWGVIEAEWGKKLHGYETKKTANSDRLHDILRVPCRSLVPDDEAFDRLFDRFEYFAALSFMGLSPEDRRGEPLWGPVGRFAWRGGFAAGDAHLYSMVSKEIDTYKGHWFMLTRPELFGFKLDRLLEAKKALEEMATRVGW